MANKRSNCSKHIGIPVRGSGSAVKHQTVDDRVRQLADIAASGDEDAAKIAAADLAREFPRRLP